MTRQKDIIKLKGTIGDITFHKTKDGHLARENDSEFGRAGKAGKVLQTALRLLLLNTSDGRMVSRLT
ncbi:hypothetical protein FHR24_003035 [Wenyingzhuangia heitensis]|uniref:Uncharacterized protein n=1 Tax=Wenyingzhuangia heitensis TaxID=1487859 RepID=A0ABX0UH81_9FLAO|nr:hypothetical protein [Wenyingzhuangia heitensis]